MALFAVLDINGLVVNTIVADSKSIAESVSAMTCVEYSDLDIVNPGITMYLDNTFVNPEPETSEPEPGKDPIARTE